MSFCVKESVCGRANAYTNHDAVIYRMGKLPGQTESSSLADMRLWVPGARVSRALVSTAGQTQQSAGLPRQQMIDDVPVPSAWGKRSKVRDCRDSSSVQKKACHLERSSLRAKVGGNGVERPLASRGRRRCGASRHRLRPRDARGSSTPFPPTFARRELRSE